jgi:uncharacterized membrane protein
MAAQRPRTANTGERATGSLIAALVLHVCLFPFWMAIGLVWAGTPARTIDRVIVNTYACTAVFGWPVVVITLVIWWWQGRDRLAWRALLAAGTLLVPIALLLLLSGRVRRAVVPPRR